MRILKFILVIGGLFLGVSSCKESKDIVTNQNFYKTQATTELLDYFADSEITKYSYYMEEGHTCQMALREATIYISYAQSEKGIVVNVVVK